MPDDELSRALQALDAPYLIDSGGTPSAFGTMYRGTTADGQAVTVTRLAPALVGAMTDVDAFVDVLAGRRHIASRRAAGIIGAGVTRDGAVFVVRSGRGAGETMADRLRRDPTIPSAELAVIADRVAALLEEEHDASLVHGLVMPATIVFDGGGITLEWSGLGQALRAGGVSAGEIGRQLRCTGYLAPELLAGAPASAPSDLFGLGATLYEALTGRPPFGGRITATVMAAVLADGVAPKPDAAVDLLTATILRAIEHDPGDRWRDARQFRNALAAARRTVPHARLRSGPVWRTRLTTLAGILAAGALLLWRVRR